MKNEFMKTTLLRLLLIFLVFSLISCTEIKKPGQNINQNNLNNNLNFESGELKKFTSKQEIIDFLNKNQISSLGYSGISFRSFSMETMAKSADSAGSFSVSNQGASDYSTTNIQIEGVDEADFIKNDNKYIYLISGNKLVIIDAYPAEDAKILSETYIEGNPRDLFLNGNKLIVFTETNEEVYGFMQYDIIPQPIYKQKTHVLVYDISNKEKPKKIKDYDVKGNYITSRMIDNYVYLIAQDYVYYYNNYLDMPVVREINSKIAITPNIYYFDMPDNNYNFNTIMALDLNNLDSENSIKAETFMMGYSNVIFVSENNIYISHMKNNQIIWGRWNPYNNNYNDYLKQRFFDVIVPLLPTETRNKINDIEKNIDLKDYEKWDKISKEIEEMYNKMSKTEKTEFMEKVEEAITEYELKREEDLKKTIIHKIEIKNGNLKYIAKGEVKGYLLNQFSMDEHNENLRVATTFDAWTNRKSITYNNVYVLDETMKVIGKLEKIAPDERIYSTRFIGNRLYMVTFQRIDPFFVIDLSNPEKPEILGELKIPGFSDYLHPYDENTIIGLGKDTKENEWGGISTNGIKLALFDVSDVNNPKQIDKFIIGKEGTDSEALYNHKAFLFSKNKNLLVIPIREVKSKEIFDERIGYYRQRVWQGAYIFDITKQGFKLKGKVSHAETEEYPYWYYGSPNAIKRSLFMDDVLYTISQKKIEMNDLNNLDNINSIKLPYNEDYYPMPYKGGIAIE